LTDLDSINALFRRWQRSVPLTDDDKRAVRALPWSRKAYARDAYLVREGQPTKVCTVLIDGFAFRQKLVTDGARQIISIHIPGELLDIQNCLLGIADHNVQALNRCTVGVIPKDSLVRLTEERPNVRRAIWLDSLIDSSIFREWVVNVGRRDAKERIAHLLCELASRLKAAGLVEDATYQFPLTQEQIGDATGLTPVHTNRTLQTLRRAGLISLSKQRLSILDWDGLAATGDFSDRYLHQAV